MNLKDETVAVVAIIIGVFLIFVGIAAYSLLPAPTNFNLGLGLGVLGIIVLIGGIVIAVTARDSKRPKTVKTRVEVKEDEVASGPEEFVPEVLLPQPGKKQLPVSTVEGIGKAYSEQLKKGGIHYVEDLALSKPEIVVELAGVKFIVAQKWIAMARLTWLDDVSNEDAECIVLGANITSIEELAVVDPEDLYNKVSTAEKFGRVQVPKGYKITKDKVKVWIESAQKEMPE
ncbi:MAG: DUF4332 domain-containing protein [Promethearchaeota archaeon]